MRNPARAWFVGESRCLGSSLDADFRRHDQRGDHKAVRDRGIPEGEIQRLMTAAEGVRTYELASPSAARVSGPGRTRGPKYVVKKGRTRAGRTCSSFLGPSRNGDSRSSTRAVISSFNASYVSSRTHSGLHLFHRRTAAITFPVFRKSKLHGCFVVANTWVNSAPKKKISEE